MQPPEGLQPYLDAFTDEINELRRRNAFLEEQYEFLLQRLEVLGDHQHEPDFTAVIHLNLGSQMRFIVATLLARHPGHVRTDWFAENLPNHDRNCLQEDEPLNQIRVLIAKIRKYFFERGVDISIVSLRDLGYALTPEAVAWIRQELPG